MSETGTYKLLWAFAVVLLGLGVAQVFIVESRTMGFGLIALGFSLIAIAASTRKKLDDG